jgi:hypothetical protein
MFGSRIAYLHEQFKKNPSKLRKKTLQEQIPQVKPSKDKLLKATTESSRM